MIAPSWPSFSQPQVIVRFALTGVKSPLLRVGNKNFFQVLQCNVLCIKLVTPDLPLALVQGKSATQSDPRLGKEWTDKLHYH